MKKGKEVGESHESPESRASRLACELRRVDEAIDMLEKRACGSSDTARSYFERA